MKKILSIILILIIIAIGVTVLADAEEVITDPDQAPDVYNPPISAVIWHEPAEAKLNYGDTVVFYSQVNNAEYYTINYYQWQCSTDCSDWYDIADANGATYTLTLDKTNAKMYYRLVISYYGE